MKLAIFAIIVLIITMNIIVIVFRRKSIQRIKALEHEKLQIQNKPIFEEMTKIKQLNMTGETEEKFEMWRAEWTEIMDIHMLEIDHLFFEAEEQIDHFKFKKIKETTAKAEKKIQLCEKKMNEILSGLNLLIGSEEKNRIEMEALQEGFREARKKILAHQPAYGATVNPLEKELENFIPQFSEYETLTESGNYLQAREIVIALTEKGNELFQLIEELPALLKDLQNTIPASLRELRNGTREMEEQSYYLQHLQLAKKFNAIEDELVEMLVNIGQLDMEGISERTEEIHEELDGMYDALEEEVVARHFVESEYEQVLNDLLNLTKHIQDMLAEVVFVQKSYRIREEEARVPQDAYDEVEQLNRKVDLITTQIEEGHSAYSIVQEEVKEVSETRQRISEEINAFSHRMKNLRNDENKVREDLFNLTKVLQEVDRSLHKGNIPGIPSDVEARLEEADEQLYIVRQSLEEVPLNMALVYSYLENAKQSVQEVREKSKELLENVVLIEYIIQYGNRYRASNERVHRQLEEAEESFRQFRYAKALEEAATAVEAVEPGAMKQIEDLLGEQVSKGL